MGRMSTYGTAVVIDCPRQAATQIVSSLTADSDGGRPQIASLASTSDREWSRVSAYLPTIDLTPVVTGLMSQAGEGRAAVAEDHDEFGASWTVLACNGGEVRVMHRRYVLNADPGDPEEIERAILDLEGDPRESDIAGVSAAAEAARIFESDPTAMVAAEAGSGSAWEGLGAVAGPFPWWDALGLSWPVPA
jgi:hypothetical protein